MLIKVNIAHCYLVRSLFVNYLLQGVGGRHGV